MKKTATSRFVNVDSVRTHFLEAGDGPPVVLLHGGDFGDRAESSWAQTIPVLAEHYRVVAPDWLGFGRTDKLYDFMGLRARMLKHMARFLELTDLADAHFVGVSMGANLLAASVAKGDQIFRPRSLALCSAGSAPDSEYRRAVLDYDCTVPAMVKMLEALFADPKWPADRAYVQRRFQWSTEPGVWEFCAAGRLRAPFLPPAEDADDAEAVVYENIRCPVLVAAGAEDKLRPSGTAQELAARIPHAELRLFEKAGHWPNIEKADEFNETIRGFLDRVNAKSSAR